MAEVKDTLCILLTLVCVEIPCGKTIDCRSGPQESSQREIQHVLSVCLKGIDFGAVPNLALRAYHHPKTRYPLAIRRATANLVTYLASLKH